MAAHSQATEQPAAAKGGMHVETWIFVALTVFFVIAAVVYAILAPTEPVGIVALSLTAGLTLIIGTFFWFISRRLDEPRPEDNDDAEVSDGAGTSGSSPRGPTGRSPWRCRHRSSLLAPRSCCGG